MKKTYIMPQMVVVELMEEEMIAQSLGAPLDKFEEEVDPGLEGLTREEVTFPKRNVWEEW